MIGRVVTVAVLLVGLSGGTAARADYATPFVEVNKEVGAVSETHGYVVALSAALEHCCNYLVIITTDTMKPVVLRATAEAGVVKAALLGRHVIIKAKVVGMTQDPGTKGVFPDLRILSLRPLALASGR